MGGQPVVWVGGWVAFDGNVFITYIESCAVAVTLSPPSSPCSQRSGKIAHVNMGP